MIKVQCPHCKYLAGSPRPNTHGHLLCFMYTFGAHPPGQFHLNSVHELQDHSRVTSVVSNDNQEIHHQSSFLTLLDRWIPSSQMFCWADMHIYEYIHINYATTYFPRTRSKNVNLSAPQWGWLILQSPDIYPALLRAMNNLSASKIWLMKSAADFASYFRMNISHGCCSLYWIHTDGIDSKGMTNSAFWNNTLG